MADERRLSIVPLPIARDRTLSDHAKLIAVAIGSFMRRDGKCSPGILAIAQERGCSERHARRGIDELVAHKHLTIQQRQRQSAILEWLHPLTGQDGVQSNPILTGQNKPLDRTKSGALRVLDRTLHVTRADQNEVINEVKRGTANVQIERSNRKRHVASTEMPVQDLSDRQRRTDEPQPLRESLTRYLQPGAEIPPRS